MCLKTNFGHFSLRKETQRWYKSVQHDFWISWLMCLPSSWYFSVQALLSMLGCRSEECQGISGFYHHIFIMHDCKKAAESSAVSMPYPVLLSHCSSLALPSLQPWWVWRICFPHPTLPWGRLNVKKAKREEKVWWSFLVKCTKTGSNPLVIWPSWDEPPQGMASCRCGTSRSLCHSGELALPSWLSSVIWASHPQSQETSL